MMVQPISAQSKKGPLNEGMNYQEVLKAWGAPNGKMEFETKREERWQYDSASATFVEGKLKSWVLESENSSATVLANDESSSAVIEAPTEASDVAVEDILNEIMSDGKK